MTFFLSQPLFEYLSKSNTDELLLRTFVFFFPNTYEANVYHQNLKLFGHRLNHLFGQPLRNVAAVSGGEECRLLWGRHGRGDFLLPSQSEEGGWGPGALHRVSEGPRLLPWRGSLIPWSLRASPAFSAPSWLGREERVSHPTGQNAALSPRPISRGSGTCGLPKGPGEMGNKFKGDLTSSPPHQGETSYFGHTNASSPIVQMTGWRLKNIKRLAPGYTGITQQSLDSTPSQRLCGSTARSVPRGLPHFSSPLLGTSGPHISPSTHVLTGAHRPVTDHGLSPALPSPHTPNPVTFSF